MYYQQQQNPITEILKRNYSRGGGLSDGYVGGLSADTQKEVKRQIKDHGYYTDPRRHSVKKVMQLSKNEMKTNLALVVLIRLLSLIGERRREAKI